MLDLAGFCLLSLNPQELTWCAVYPLNPAPEANMFLCFPTNHVVSAAVFPSKEMNRGKKKPSHLSPGRGPQVLSQWRSRWPQIAPHPDTYSPPSSMGKEALQSTGGKAASISPVGL